MGGLVEQWADVLRRVPRTGDLLGLVVSVLPIVVALLAAFLLPPLLTPPRPATGSGAQRDRGAWLLTGGVVLVLATIGVAMAAIHVGAVERLSAEGFPLPRPWMHQLLVGGSVVFALGAMVLWWSGRPELHGTTANEPDDARSTR